MIHFKQVKGLHLILLIKLFFLLLLLAGCKLDSSDSIQYNIPTSSGEGAIEPEKALSSFELPPGFKIELIASEPLISDPVDMVIDEDGRFYVLEMHGYPLDTSGTGKIKLLEDSDGDGKMEEATVFADNLIMPFGITRWKNGIIVADAPDILYLEDTNGDGKADVREVMLTGFAFSNAQMNAGNPMYGLDNWLYLTSEAPGAYQVYNEIFGYMGDDIYFPAHPDSANIPQQPGRTVRFKPDQYELELTAGMTQFGHDFDAWGRRILGNNSNHIYHEVVSTPYLERNPDLVISDVTQTLSDHGSKVFPITENPERQLLTSEGEFTAACGNTAYSGNIFPPPFEKAFFVAEPVSNVVHVDLLEDKGSTFTAIRSRPEEEFLASTDAWFRPVNMYSGPDGALYVLDYYRQIIEHPEWMSKEAIERGELYNGLDMGRIYRITPTNAESAAWTGGLDFGDSSNEELVEQLANPNGWWRLNAQRLLVDRGSIEVVPQLEEIVSNSASSMGRLHALWTLEGVGEIKSSIIKEALKDSVPGVRENAIKLAEHHLEKDEGLVQDLLKMNDDPDPKVRFQLLLTLGFVDGAEAARVRNDLLFKNLNDKWFQIAALSASSSQAESLLTMVLDNYEDEDPAFASFVERVTAVVGVNGTSEDIDHLILEATEKPAWAPAVPVLRGLATGLEGDKKVSEQVQNILVESFFDHPSDEVQEVSLEVLKVTGIQDEEKSKAAIKRAVSIVENDRLNDEKRRKAINFLALYDPRPHTDLLKNLIVPQEKTPVQIAALEILSLIPDKTVSHFVLQKWPTLSLQVRNAALNTFLSDRDRVEVLLEALEVGQIEKSAVSFPVSVRLMTGYGDGITERARALFASEEKEDINEEYEEALELEGSAAEGKAIYLNDCAVCHTKGDLGTPFGPDLGTIQGWNAEAILAHILDPNISIAAGYDLWTVTLNNGQTLGGVISSETPSAITLRNAGDIENTIDRGDIESLQKLDISGMPAGLEEQISPQEMADLLAYLRDLE